MEIYQSPTFPLPAKISYLKSIWAETKSRYLNETRRSSAGLFLRTNVEKEQNVCNFVSVHSLPCGFVMGSVKIIFKKIRRHF